ncbi:hypothetical protein AB0J83_32195 [Actinoplanes sp. NPDC049596]|uniref:hypothetical protein n=1 Tax=unclassified Actinoplanes TaxID=2626549 RepID=UPI003431022F
MSDAGHVSEIELPGTGWWLQWRRDGSWRDLNDAQHRDEAAGLYAPADDDWAAWTGDPQPRARGGDWDGAPTWWLAYGELPADGEVVTVVLDDGTHPAVHVLGRVWACEWRAAAQPAIVHVADQTFVLPFTEPMYRRWLDEGPADDGWFRPGLPG